MIAAARETLGERIRERPVGRGRDGLRR